MFELLALAWETDLTRVATFMLGRELTGRTYAEIGVADAHHPISHHQRDPEKLAKLTKINQYHNVDVFSRFWNGCARRRTATARCSTIR